MAEGPNTTTAMSDDQRGGQEMEKLAYSVPEVAEMLGISRASAYTYVRTGVIPSLQLGGRIVIPCRVLDELLDIKVAS